MITCTCAVRGPETCPHPQHRAGRGGIAALDAATARALALLPDVEPLPLAPADD